MKKKYFILLTEIFILNLIWEIFHYRLYNDLTGIPPAVHLILASFVDVILISVCLLFLSAKNKNFQWINSMSKPDYFLLGSLATFVAFFWELGNLSLGRWSYTDAMPVIFSVGLSPLIQLPVTAILSLIFLRKLIS